MKIYIRAAIKALGDEDFFTQLEIAKDPNTSEDVLSELAESAYDEVRVAILGNPNTPPEIIDDAVNNITTFDTTTVKALGIVAGNPSTLDATLIKLADIVVNHLLYGSLAPTIYKPLLENPNTPTESLQILLDYNTHAHALTEPLIRHPNVTLDVLKELLIKDNGYCRYFDDIAKIHTLSYDFLRYFVEHGCSADRRGVAECNQTPQDLLLELVNDSAESGYIADDAIKNPNLSGDALLELYNNTESPRIIRDVLRNKNCPSSILAEVADQCLANSTDQGLSEVAKHPNTPIEVLYDIFNASQLNSGKYSYIYALEMLALNPNVPSDISAQLAKLDVYMQQCVARNPNTDPNVLASLVKAKYEVRELLAKNPNTPLATLKKLAKDKSKAVKYALEENPNIDDEVINTLLSQYGYGPSWHLQRNPRYKELYGGEES